ncbi:MAG: DUF819 family protein [Planctomycetota bacterium]
MLDHPLLVLAVLALNVALAEWLCRRTPLRHLGTALLVILLTALVANLGLVPTYSGDVAVYGGIFGYVAPLGIFWLLLGVRLGEVLRAGRAMIGLFLLGSAGTAVGVLIAMRAVGGEEAFGANFAALGGMFVGTYTGGSVNFNAVALHYGVVEEGVLYAGATAVDNLMTTLWMAVNLLVPRIFGRRWPRRRGPDGAPLDAPAGSAPGATDARRAPDLGIEEDTEAVHPVDLAWLVALGAATVAVSDVAAGWFEATLGFAVPSILVLTTIALVLAQVPAIARIRGARMIGMFAVYLFLAVIGALCDVEALREIGPLGVRLFAFVVIAVGVHGVFVYATSAALRIDPELASVASQANVGGGTSALALARSLGRSDLVLPAILVGSLGMAVGTYLGFLTADLLAP